MEQYFFNSADGWTFDSATGCLGSGGRHTGTRLERGTRVLSDWVSGGGFGDGDTVEVLYEPSSQVGDTGEPSLSVLVNGAVIGHRIRVGSIPEPDEEGGLCWVVASAATGLEGDASDQQSVRIRRTDPAEFTRRLAAAASCG